MSTCLAYGIIVSLYIIACAVMDLVILPVPETTYPFIGLLEGNQ